MPVSPHAALYGPSTHTTLLLPLPVVANLRYSRCQRNVYRPTRPAAAFPSYSPLIIHSPIYIISSTVILTTTNYTLLTYLLLLLTTLYSLTYYKLPLLSITSSPIPIVNYTLFLSITLSPSSSKWRFPPERHFRAAYPSSRIPDSAVAGPCGGAPVQFLSRAFSLTASLVPG